MFYAYVLYSEKTGRRYTGSCQDVIERVLYHNGGHVKSTRHGVPWRLIHVEELDSRAEAVIRERFLKTGVGREELVRRLQSEECKSVVEELNRAVAQSG